MGMTERQSPMADFVLNGDFVMLQVLIEQAVRIILADNQFGTPEQKTIVTKAANFLGDLFEINSKPRTG